jgi:hypothetical protein
MNVYLVEPFEQYIQQQLYQENMTQVFDLL